MSGASKIDGTSTPSEPIEPLELLFAQLHDLLLIHYEASLLQSETRYLQESDSLYLIASQFVSGEKSVAKSYMRFALSLNTDAEGAGVDVPLTLELSVSNGHKSCLQKP